MFSAPFPDRIQLKSSLKITSNIQCNKIIFTLLGAIMQSTRLKVPCDGIPLGKTKNVDSHLFLLLA